MTEHRELQKNSKFYLLSTFHKISCKQMRGTKTIKETKF